MKALGWALIIVGGGLVALGGRTVLASRNEVPEPEETQTDDGQDVHDLNDGV